MAGAGSTGHIAEAWLVGTETADGGEAYICVLRLGIGAGGLAGEIAAEITRIGQIRASRPFAVTVAEEETRLLAAARRLGIGLVG
jgi:hypothetical protein